MDIIGITKKKKYAHGFWQLVIFCIHDASWIDYYYESKFHLYNLQKK